jgi:RNA polymerase sigma factor (sigma-70 family)
LSRKLSREDAEDIAQQAAIECLTTTVSHEGDAGAFGGHVGRKTVARKMWTNANRRADAMEHRGEVIVYDEVEDAGESPDLHMLTPETLASLAEQASRLTRAVERLPVREAEVMRGRLGIGFQTPQTQSEIAAVLGVSRQRVAQYEEKAVARLRSQLREVRR